MQFQYCNICNNQNCNKDGGGGNLRTIKSAINQNSQTAPGQSEQGQILSNMQTNKNTDIFLTL